MLMYPHINPVALSLGPVQIYWYGLMYLIGFALAWCLGMWRAKRTPGWQTQEINDLIFYCMLGVVIGGRLGYILFYQFTAFLQDPLMLFRLWQGGMSFHGGFLGVLCAFQYFAWKTKRSFFSVADFTAPLVPLALGAGRIGNFINGELWGRVTTMPWGMVFPEAGALPRHPSQLYQFFTEGVILFIIVWWYSAKPRPRMAVSGLFALSYGVLRFCTEFFREPDAHLGFILTFTMGQWLSLPMIIAGGVAMYYAYHSKERIS